LVQFAAIKPVTGSESLFCCASHKATAVDVWCSSFGERFFLVFKASRSIKSVVVFPFKKLSFLKQEIKN
jgi:hypothetical protein